MEIQDGICTLCLEKCDNFIGINENTKNMLDILLPKMASIDFTAIQGPVMCKNCEEMLIKYFDFKTTCLHTHNYIVSFLNKEEVKLNLSDVYLSKSATGIGVPEDQDVCGFCMGLVENFSAVSVDVEEGDVMLENMIKQCLPELDLGIIKKPVICSTCHGSLEGCFHFVTICLNVGERIKKYYETADINSKSQIELSSSPQSTMRDAPTGQIAGRSVEIIKVEKQFCDDKENPVEGGVGNRKDTVKLEMNAEEDIGNRKVKLEMNDHEGNNKQLFIPMLICSGENNKLGSVKIEKTFCEENETKYKKENLIEMEEQNCLVNEDIEIKTDDHDFNRFEDGIVLPQSEISSRLCRRQKCSMPNPEKGQSNPHIKNTLTKKHVSKIRMYKCESCSFQTKYKGGLSRHRILHKNPSELTVYKCDSCSFQTKSKCCLKRHSLRHKDPSEVTKYNCDFCSYWTKRKDGLKVHLLKHKDPSELTMYKCNFCPFQTQIEGTLKIHLLTHKDSSEVTMYKCESCSFQTKYKGDLNKHLILHKNPSEIAMYKCEHCSFETKHKAAIRYHQLVHKDLSEITMYECYYCSFQTKEKRHLRSHLLNHKDPTELTIYKCDSCSYQTKHKNYLKRHHSIVHKNPSKVVMHKCEHCSFQTKEKSYLRRHLLTHKNSSQVTMYKCDLCSFQTRNKYYFQKYHLLVHKDPSEVTMYKCNCCSFQTRYKRYLRAHLKVHRNPLEIIRYKCDFCPFETIQKYNLMGHLLEHKNSSEVLMYKCDSCSFQTKHKNSLKRHSRLHKIHQK